MRGPGNAGLRDGGVRSLFEMEHDGVAQEEKLDRPLYDMGLWRLEEMTFPINQLIYRRIWGLLLWALGRRRARSILSRFSFLLIFPTDSIPAVEGSLVLTGRVSYPRLRPA